MLALLFSKVTSGIWKYLIIIGGSALVVAKIFSMGRSHEKGKQAARVIENVKARNEALEDTNSLSDADVDRQLREHINNKDRS